MFSDVFEYIGSVLYGLSTLVEGALSRELMRVGGSLTHVGERIGSLAPTDRAVCAATSTVSSVGAWWGGLSDLGQAGAFGAAVLASLLTFVFGMPLVVDFLLGGVPILAPVPVPSQDVVEDDDSEGVFAPEDVAPQMLRAGVHDGVRALACHCPMSGEYLGNVAADTPETAAEKIARARAAQPALADASYAQRKRVLSVLRNYILEEQHDLCAISMLDTGKTMVDASLGEVLTTLEKLRWVCDEGEAALTGDVRATGPATMHKAAAVEYQPLGVIGAIAPWNYPMHNFFNPVISGLFAGNAVVVKPSEHTVYSSVHYARIVRRALVLCGFSADLVQLLVGGPDVGEALVRGDIDKLFFTGSTAVGKMVSVAAAERLLPVVLELGGKDPFIICDDADVAHAANLCLRGTFQNAGQNCIGVERVFVHKKVKAALVKRFTEAASAIRVGVDMGAITMGEPAMARIQALVDDAKKMGAEVLAGGRVAKGEGDNAGGWFYEATVLDRVTPEMRIAQEEVFGPVLSIFEWSSDKEVVEMANASKFGLGSSVFSGDARRADKILAALRCGMGSVNDYAVHYMCQSLPFGGTKESGSDRFAGIEGLRGCCLAKTVVRDRFPGIKTMIPANIKYPVYDNAFAFTAELNDIMYRQGRLVKLDNARNIVLMLLSKTWEPRSIGSR